MATGFDQTEEQIAANLLNSSFKDINRRFEELTENEREIVQNEENWNRLLRWVDTYRN